jgi:ABC-type antimicrobial peptide transport system permease subunit
MKHNIFLQSTFRQLLRTNLLFLLIGTISFVFVSKAVGFILVQRETETLGSYYRSIGVLENVNNPGSGDVSTGIELIKTSSHFAYGNPAEVVSGVMSQTYNTSFLSTNATVVIKALPQKYWPNTHNTDIWFTGELLEKEEIGADGKPLQANGKAIGYSLKFNIDTLLAAYPENASQGGTVVLLFLFEKNESAIPAIRNMEVGQRYLIRAWDDYGSLSTLLVGFRFQILPLDDQQLWYKPLAKDEIIDFSSPEMTDIKNRIDILNENLHSLGIIATADLSAMPRMQEAAHFYTLTAGRWLNHQDDLNGAKLIVIPEKLASQRKLNLGDTLQLTFRPLRDTYYGQIRDGIDSILWRSYPTYQEPFTIVGIYTSRYGAVWSYIPSGSLQPGFTSATQPQSRDEAGFTFVLDSSRSQTLFVQQYQDALQSLGISLTFLDNNGAAYWTAVDPIRRSSSADALIFSLLMIAALIMVVFLYLMQHRRAYAIARALGVPGKQANRQVILPLLLFGSPGILLGGLFSWNNALGKAKANLSSIPTPAGVAPSAELNPFFLVALCLAIFLLLTLFAWLGVQFLSKQSVFELLQGKTLRQTEKKRAYMSTRNRPISPISLIQTSAVENAPIDPAATQAAPVIQGKYTPASLSRYVLRQAQRSGAKSILTLAIALGFMFASGWLSHTMQRSQAEIDRLYSATVVEADILPLDPTSSQPLGSVPHGNGFVYLNTVNSVLDSGYVISSNLEAETLWSKIQATGSQKGLTNSVSVYAYDSLEALTSGLADPATLVFTSGWDANRFAGQWTLDDIQKEGIPMLFPSSLLDQSQFEVGQKVNITEMSGSISPGVIVGQYSGGRAVTVNHVKTTVIGSEPILIPLTALEALERSKTAFTVTHFVLDPAKNRELSQISAEMEKVIKAPGAGTKDLRFMIWDEKLRIVVSQLEKNLSILKVLYPVVMAVSVLIAAGLCFLLLQQKKREAAILRVLGTTLIAVRLALIAEPFCLSFLGVIIGLGLSILLWISSGSVPMGSLLTSAGLYLAGALAGLAGGAIVITQKKPLELLQVKE